MLANLLLDIRECMVDMGGAQEIQRARNYWSFPCPATWSSATPVLKSNPIAWLPSPQLKEGLYAPSENLLQACERCQGYPWRVDRQATPSAGLWFPCWYSHPPTHKEEMCPLPKDLAPQGARGSIRVLKGFHHGDDLKQCWWQWNRRDLGKAEVQSAEGSWKCVWV